MRYFLGIDPGKNGSFSLIDEEYKIVKIDKMPTVDLSKKEIDVDALSRQLRHIKEDCRLLSCCVEKAQAMPKQGTVSMFSFGMAYGILLGILTTLCIPYSTVHPRTWTKSMFKGVSGKGKQRAYVIAKQMFPEWNPGFKYEQDYADSLLLAAYSRKMWGYK